MSRRNAGKKQNSLPMQHMLVKFADSARMRFLVLLAAAAALAGAAEPAKHPFGADDWAGLHSAFPAAVSPDGATILAAVTFGRDVDSATDYAIAQGWADANRLASAGIRTLFATKTAPIAPAVAP